MKQEFPAVEWTYDPHRVEVNVLLRRPFYANLRFGRTQNALWVGGPLGNIFNWFPMPWSEYSRTLGRDSRRTLFAQLRGIRSDLDILRHPDKASLYDEGL